MVSRRGRSWADTLFNLTVVSAAAQSNNDLLANAPTSDTLTVVRIIGDLWWISSSLTVQSTGAERLDVGIGVTSTEAFGVNATPDVNTDSEYPPRGWLYISSTMFVHDRTAAEPGIEIPSRLAFDIRAQRRIDKGKLYMAVSSNNVVGSSVTGKLVGRVRALCLT